MSTAAAAFLVVFTGYLLLYGLIPRFFHSCRRFFIQGPMGRPGLKGEKGDPGFDPGEAETIRSCVAFLTPENCQAIATIPDAWRTLADHQKAIQSIQNQLEEIQTFVVEMETSQSGTRASFSEQLSELQQLVPDIQNLQAIFRSRQAARDLPNPLPPEVLPPPVVPQEPNPAPAMQPELPPDVARSARIARAAAAKRRQASDQTPPAGGL